MTAMAARTLGYDVHALDPDPDCSARPVVDRLVPARFDDDEAAGELARHCDVVTLEIEQIAVPSLEAAARHAPLRPSAAIVSMVQDRARQKRWLTEHDADDASSRKIRQIQRPEELGGKELERSVGALVVTLGADGSKLYTDGRMTRIEPQPVEAIDATAAGDAFVGAVAFAIARGSHIPDAVRLGGAAGAAAATKLGARPSLPFPEDLKRLFGIELDDVHD